MRNAEYAMETGQVDGRNADYRQRERIMSYENLKRRTKKFGLDVIRLVERLPKDEVGRVLGRQLLRSGTSVGANYRAACRAKSCADFISKLGNVEEEADESGFWPEMLVDAQKLELATATPFIHKYRP